MGLFRRALVSYHDAMQLSQAIDQSNAPPGPAGFSPAALLLAIAVSPVVGIIWAWIAETVQFYVAPFLLFPLLVGVFTGLTLVGLTRFAQIGHRPTILAAVVFAAAIAAAGQHYLHYLSTYSRPVVRSDSGKPIISEEAAQWISDIRREMTPSFGKYMLEQGRRGRPLPGGYVAKDWAAWLAWIVDVLLTVAAAILVTIPGIRVPYCNRCRTWYHTVRNGKIDVVAAQRLAEICKTETLPDCHSPRYRLSCCQGGCGPTRCELSWEEPSGAVDLFRVWLDGEQRNEIAVILDGLADER
jgi:hypothetical protein